MYEYVGQINKVVDGDTVDVTLDLGFNINHKIRLRLARIDAPETYGVIKDSAEYLAGSQAKNYVESFLSLTNFKVKIATFKDKTDKYGRYLAEIVALEGPNKDKNLCDEMLSLGFAVLYV